MVSLLAAWIALLSREVRLVGDCTLIPGFVVDTLEWLATVLLPDGSCRCTLMRGHRGNAGRARLVDETG